MSEHHNTLATEKYLVKKMQLEVKAFRRQQAGQSIKTFVTLTSLLCFFGVATYALCTNPNLVPDSLDFMRANGILSY